ncbi:growth arrest and DNA damage-inducible protein GADD45 alpha-like [Uranotaenia lowii]|uniref:growth arrest and DNA damage-inducible protein GADD45 alpha-like n=1 Tax=Uranotaenia lowii TaxID=190385 RepID=UPI00247896F7|nr:growth arrest and DNA damage-inducible protein GADD45 alpha-like [Uranotaenia lowii]
MVISQAHIPSSKMSKAGFETVGIGSNIRTTLIAAAAERRTVIGMTNAIRSLRDEPQNYIFCFIASSKQPDSGAHMQQVLLEAFCFENDIYIIKVDSATKLSRLLGSTSNIQPASCVLVQKSRVGIGVSENSNNTFSRSENLLIDHCEFYWDEPNKPVIKLPEK